MISQSHRDDSERLGIRSTRFNHAVKRSFDRGASGHGPSPRLGMQPEWHRALGADRDVQFGGSVERHGFLVGLFGTGGLGDNFRDSAIAVAAPSRPR